MPDSPHAPWALRGGFSRAVLFLHGILGSPSQFRAMGQVLHAAGWDCAAALLPGHGGAQADFSPARSADWLEAARREVDGMTKEYGRVVIFAHSMGCLLALQIAAQNASVRGLILLSPALSPKVSPRQVRHAAHVLFADPARDGTAHAAYREAFSVQRGPVWGYLRWALPLFSLARLSRAARSALPEVRCPVLALQGARDESVRRSGIRKLARALPGARTAWLPDSGHICFSPADAQKIGEETLNFLAQIDPASRAEAVNPSSSD